MGAHESPLDRLSLSQWLRYRRLYRAMVESAWRKGEPLDRAARSTLRAEARRVAGELGLARLEPSAAANR